MAWSSMISHDMSPDSGTGLDFWYMTFRLASIDDAFNEPAPGNR